MKEKKIGTVGWLPSGVPVLMVESKTQFCYHCGGWSALDMVPCPVCFGCASIKVALPASEEITAVE